MRWSRRSAPRSAATDDERPDLLEVWSPSDEPPPASPDATVWNAFLPAPRVESGDRTCIRFNCRREGRPTFADRCPTCEHRTQPLRDYRWPRVQAGVRSA